MSDDPTTLFNGPLSTRVETDLPGNYEIQNSENDGAWITKKVPESVTDAMNAAPIGSFQQITYANLASRLRNFLSEGQSGLDLAKEFVYSAINFRSLNPNWYAGGVRAPTTPANAGSGVGSYHSSVWGNNKDERIPQTLPETTTAHTYAAGQDPTPIQSKGTLIAKLYQDLQNHLPLVLFNVTSKDPKPIGVGGSSTSKTFYRDGLSVFEVAYMADVEVEVLVFTEDDQGTSHLQALVETAFFTLRDYIGNGSEFSGPTWSLTMPTSITTSPITDMDAPWANGDDRGGKLYTATIGLTGMKYEAIKHVAKRVRSHIIDDPGTGASLNMYVTGQEDVNEPIQLTIGRPTRLFISGAPLDADVLVSDGHAALALKKPYAGSGFFELIPRRTGTATLKLYATGMTIDSAEATIPVGRAKEPLLQRKVVISAV